MFLGIALTLGAVTATTMMTRHGASVAVVARILDGLAGLLIVFGLRELVR